MRRTSEQSRESFAKRVTELADVLQRGLPPSVKELSIVRHYDYEFKEAMQEHGGIPQNVDTEPTPHRRAGEVLALASRSLERLSVAFMIDAREFFETLQNSGEWPNLKFLALTSPILSSSTPEEEIHQLLAKAASVVAKLPQLHELVLWNYDAQTKESCAFDFCQTRAYRGEEMTDLYFAWRANWQMKIHDDVDAWEKTLGNQAKLGLTIVHESFDLAANTAIDAARQLQLPKGILLGWPE